MKNGSKRRREEDPQTSDVIASAWSLHIKPWYQRRSRVEIRCVICISIQQFQSDETTRTYTRARRSRALAVSVANGLVIIFS